MRRDDIPAKYLVPHIQEWMNRANVESDADALLSIAERVGVHESYIRAILAGPTKYRRMRNLPFDTADRILCAIDGVCLWHSDPNLAPLYGRACKGADAISLGERDPIAYARDQERKRKWRQAQKAKAA